MKCLVVAACAFYAICRLARRLTDRSQDARASFVFNQICEPDTRLIVRGEIKFMELKEGQQTVVTATPRTRKGHPAQIEPGSATWESSDPAVASVTPDPNNELSATVTGEDGTENESVVITLRADGRAGEGERPVIGTLSLVVTAGDATVFDLAAAEPTDAAAAEDAGGGE